MPWDRCLLSRCRLELHLSLFRLFYYLLLCLCTCLPIRYVYLLIDWFIYPSFSQYIYLFVFLCISVSLPVCFSASVSIYTCLYIDISPFVCPSTNFYKCIFLVQYVHFNVPLSVIFSFFLFFWMIFESVLNLFLPPICRQFKLSLWLHVYCNMLSVNFPLYLKST